MRRNVTENTGLSHLCTLNRGQKWITVNLHTKLVFDSRNETVKSSPLYFGTPVYLTSDQFELNKIAACRSKCGFQRILDSPVQCTLYKQ